MPHSSNTSAVVLLAAVVGVLAFTLSVQCSPASESELKSNFAAEHETGRRYHIDPADLPAPKTGPIVTDRPLIVPYSGQTLQVPTGFAATLFATGLANPRRLLVLANGDVLVAEQSAGYVTLLRDDGEGHAKWIDRHVEDLNRPYGLAWQGRSSSCRRPGRHLAGAACRRGGARQAAPSHPNAPTNCRRNSAGRCPAPTAPR